MSARTQTIGRISAIFLTALLTACASGEIQRKDGMSSARPFQISNLAKGDVDVVCEIHQQGLLASLKKLTEKLYKRNPHEWQRGGYESLESAVKDIFAHLEHWQVAALKDSDWEASIRLAFAEEYTGDRVHALMSGLTVMLMAAYDQKTQFFLLDQLDAQKLYNSARNVEVAVWKLSNARNAKGELFLLTNGTDDNGVANLSFEREFGKIIATQDSLARVIEDKNNRAIRQVLTNAASFVFLPI
jgi:hypothetical protein